MNRDEVAAALSKQISNERFVAEAQNVLDLVRIFIRCAESDDTSLPDEAIDLVFLIAQEQDRLIACLYTAIACISAFVATMGMESGTDGEYVLKMLEQIVTDGFGK